MYDNYFRYYDPGLDRYVQSDPTGLDGGINTFGYAKSNPLKYIDPFGLVWVTIGYDYHGMKNWGLTFANRTRSMADQSVMSIHDCIACSRDVIQEWQEHPNDPPCGPKPGDRRKIKQTFNKHPDSWAISGESWHWSPAVASPTWKDY